MTTLKSLFTEPQRDFSTFRCQLPLKLLVWPAHTPHVKARSTGAAQVGENAEAIRIAHPS
jgi:hypothetical protein